MVPTVQDLIAVVIKVGEAIRDVGPFLLIGVLLSRALDALWWREVGNFRTGPIVAAVAALPLGTGIVAAEVLRAFLDPTETAMPSPKATRPSGLFRSALAVLDDLLFPYLLAALVGGLIAVLIPTGPLWSLLAPPGVWRLVVAPLVVGLLRPRGGSELPLVAALMAKGLDPAGAVAAVIGATYLHHRSCRRAALQISLGVAVGAAVWLLGMIGSLPS